MRSASDGQYDPASVVAGSRPHPAVLGLLVVAGLSRTRRASAVRYPGRVRGLLLLTGPR